MITFAKELERIGELFQDSATLAALHKIEEAATIYSIHYCRGGVGFQFYEPPEDFEIDFKYLNDEWRKYLVVHQYYPTFEKAVEEEHKRLEL